MKIRSIINKAQFARLGVGVLMAVIAFRCIEPPTKPIIPTSDIQMSIPLVDETRTVDDLFRKSSTTVKTDAAGYYFEDNQPTKPVPIDSIRLTSQSQGIQASVGTLTIPGITPVSQSFNVAAIGIPATVVPPLVTLPANQYTIPSLQIDKSDSISFIAVKSGSLTLTITNNLPVSISFPNGLTLKNNKTSAPVDTNNVATFAFPTIPSRGSNAQTADLAGKTLRGFLRTAPVTINTGSLTGPDTIKSTDRISFSFSSTPFSTDTVLAVIPNQNLASFKDSIITLDPTSVLNQATFSYGRFGLTINNQTGLNVGAQLKFDNFVSTKPTLDTLIIDQIIQPHTQYQKNVNLDTIQIVNGDVSRPGTTMKFTVKIRTVNSGGAIPASTITSSDFVSATFAPQQTFAVKSLTGKMKPMTLGVNTGASGANLSEAATKFSITSAQFDSVKMALRLALSSGFPVTYSLSIVAENRKVKPFKIDSLVVPPPLGGSIQPGLNNIAEIVLDNSIGLNKFLGKFFPNFPDTFIVHGTTTINPGFATGKIYDTTKVYYSVDTYFPLKIALSGSYSDVYAIQAGVDTAVVRDAKIGTLNFEIGNRIPIGLSLRAGFFRWDSLTKARDTLLIVPTNGLPQPVHPASAPSGFAVDPPVMTRFSISLGETDMVRFSKTDSLYVTLGVVTSSLTNPVRVQSSDYIRVRASGNIIYTLHGRK